MADAAPGEPAADSSVSFRHSHVSARDSSLHVVEAGDPQSPPFLFLHGWPESWRSWRSAMALAAGHSRAIATDASKITPDARAAYVAAHATDGALTPGFNWYRTFPADAEENTRSSSARVTPPLLYLRGEHERGDIDTYVRGFQVAGIVRVERGTVPGAGHFTQEESPCETWRKIASFAGVAG